MTHRSPSLRSALNKGFTRTSWPIERFSINGWNINCVKMIMPQNMLKTPIIILSDLLHSYSTSLLDFESLAEDYPVYILELPGCGENFLGAKSIRHLDNFHFVDLLASSISYLGLERFSIVSFTGHCSVVYEYAIRNESQVKDICFIAATNALRKSIVALLENCLNHMEEGRLEEFSSSLVASMMNLSKEKQIKSSSNIYHSMRRYLLNSLESNSEVKEVYRSSILRLINQAPLGSGPRCPCLFISGEYDQFINPFESYELSKKCLQSQFATVKSSDHFVMKEKTTQVVNVIKEFFSKGQINGVRGVRPWSKKSFPVSSMRLNSRVHVGLSVKLKKGDVTYNAVIDEMSVDGCSLRIESKNQKCEMNLSGQLGGILKLDAPDLCFSSDVIIFETKKSRGEHHGHDFYLRGLFLREGRDKMIKRQESLSQIIQDAKLSA